MSQTNSNRTIITIDRNDVQVGIPADRVIREVLKAMEQRDAEIYRRSPGFIGMAALASHQSTQLTMAIVDLSRKDEETWNRVEQSTTYMREVGASLTNGGQSLGVYVNGAIAAASSKATNAQLRGIWGEGKSALFQANDLAQFLTEAAQLEFSIPSANGEVTKNGAQLLREKAQETPTPDAKAFAALCLASEQYAAKSSDVNLNGEDIVNAFKTLRDDGTQFEQAPASVRQAVRQFGHRGANGQQGRQVQAQA